jgi:protein-S-isoprenylcysteine O-methyltransferase Ste14
MDTLNNGDHTRHHAEREDLAGEHPFGDLGQVLLLLIFLVVWLSDAFFFHYSIVLSSYLPFWLRLLGAAILLNSAVWLARTSHDMIFAEVRKHPSVIRKGVFGRVRHPLYLSAIVFYPGLLCLIFSIAAALIWIGIIGFYHFLARYEERLLLKKFGADYAAYLREVPMWIPRIITHR